MIVNGSSRGSPRRRTSPALASGSRLYTEAMRSYDRKQRSVKKAKKEALFKAESGVKPLKKSNEYLVLKFKNDFNAATKT